MRSPDLRRFHFGTIPGTGAFHRRIPRTERHRLAFLRRLHDRGPTFRATLLTVGLLGLVWIEAATGMLQAFAFSTINSKLHYRIEPGRSARIAFPSEGPFDSERGYREVPAFSIALAAHRMQIHEQARFSTGLLLLNWLKIPLSYPDKPVAGLVIRDSDGDTLFDAAARRQWFRSYEQVPPMVASSLTYIENRNLQARTPHTQNPAVDWGRLARATVMWSGRAIGLPLPVEGGSTLAVQLVKYRHTGDGRTESPLDKLRQIAAASLTAYRQGPDTRDARKQFLLDYLNTMPLAGVPGFGEVSGINDGLTAWFGLDPEQVWSTLATDTSAERRAQAYKPVLALLCAAQAPSRFLRRNPAALERRVNAFTRIFEREGIIDPALARATLATPMVLLQKPRSARPELPASLRSEDKPAYTVRRDLAARLGVRDFYTLDRLDLDVQTTLDDGLQERVLAFFRQLADTSFVNAHGLRGERLLESGDPSKVKYSLLLYESDPAGDHVCAQVDNLDAPFDLNTGMKLELGSTAKLRTLTHYLQIVDTLHTELGALGPGAIAQRVAAARDPITRDLAGAIAAEPGIGPDSLLRRALDRRYSSNPGEMFFTGGGAHAFHNFDPEENGRKLSIHDGFVSSNNLVFVRLMRDVVRWHEARLPYDAHAVLMGEDMASREKLLRRAADDEARQILARAWRRMSALPPGGVEREMLGEYPGVRSRAALFYAWNHGASPRQLAAWLKARTPKPAAGGPAPKTVPVPVLAHTYGNRDFTLLDYGYMLRRHPLEVWCAGEIARSPGVSFAELWSRSMFARQLCRQWLMSPDRFQAQNLRLRARIERDAFERMTPDWRALGFPFERLVPSFATALGASGDRPAALAELMGVIVGDGMRRPSSNVRRLVLAGGTPYHTAFEPLPQEGRRVLSPEVAQCLRGLLAEVVSHGTARRVDGVFMDAETQPLAIGGKTGSGDNGRRVRAGWRSTSRTATFAFYLGDRHYGVITASVWGKGSGRYKFTSSLPLAVLRLLAPTLSDHLGDVRVVPVAPGMVAKPPAPPVVATRSAPGAPRPLLARFL